MRSKLKHLAEQEQAGAAGAPSFARIGMAEAPEDAAALYSTDMSAVITEQPKLYPNTMSHGSDCA